MPLITDPVFPLSTTPTPNDAIPVHDVESNLTKHTTIQVLKDTVLRINKKLVTGTTYTFIATDKDQMLLSQSTSACSYTLPNGLWQEGDTIHVSQDAIGQITFVQGSGVTIQSPPNTNLKTRGIHSTITLWLKTKGVTDVWKIWGDLEAS